MDTFRMSDFRRLAECVNGPNVTICMPTQPAAGLEGQQDAVKLKQLVDRVEKQLASSGMRASDARDLLEPVRHLPDDELFWEHRGNGLAIFLNQESFERFRLPIRLEEVAKVHDRYQLKSLLPMLGSDERLYILTLSQNNTRLFEASEFQIEPIDVPGLPPRMDEALDLQPADPGAQSHSSGKSGSGKQSAVFHGQGGVKDTHKDDLKLYFRMISKALQPLLSQQKAPLVLAGVEYELAMFRETCHYSQIAATEVTGNFDYLPAGEILKKAWPLIHPLLMKDKDNAQAKYREFAGTGLATDDMQQVLAAAYQGRIETLFCLAGAHQWELATHLVSSLNLTGSSNRRRRSFGCPSGADGHDRWQSLFSSR